MSTTVYVASKAYYGPLWQSLRGELAKTSDVRIISTWIDESGQGKTVDWPELWDRCIEEAATADALVAFYFPGDTWKGALVEIGAALACGKPVYVAGSPDHSWVNHPNVTLVATVDEAFALLGQS